jgi:hypothetical protein
LTRFAKIGEHEIAGQQLLIFAEVPLDGRIEPLKRGEIISGGAQGAADALQAG